MNRQQVLWQMAEKAADAGNVLLALTLFETGRLAMPVDVVQGTGFKRSGMNANGELVIEKLKTNP